MAYQITIYGMIPEAFKIIVTAGASHQSGPNRGTFFFFYHYYFLYKSAFDSERNGAISLTGVGLPFPSANKLK